MNYTDIEEKDVKSHRKETRHQIESSNMPYDKKREEIIGKRRQKRTGRGGVTEI